jgi:hypothetical protein
MYQSDCVEHFFIKATQFVQLNLLLPKLLFPDQLVFSLLSFRYAHRVSTKKEGNVVRLKKGKRVTLGTSDYNFAKL